MLGWFKKKFGRKDEKDTGAGAQAEEALPEDAEKVSEEAAAPSFPVIPETPGEEESPPEHASLGEEAEEALEGWLANAAAAGMEAPAEPASMAAEEREEDTVPAALEAPAGPEEEKTESSPDSPDRVEDAAAPEEPGEGEIEASGPVADSAFASEDDEDVRQADSVSNWTALRMELPADIPPAPESPLASATMVAVQEPAGAIAAAEKGGEDSVPAAPESSAVPEEEREEDTAVVLAGPADEASAGTGPAPADDEGPEEEEGADDWAGFQPEFLEEAPEPERPFEEAAAEDGQLSHGEEAEESPQLEEGDGLAPALPAGAAKTREKAASKSMFQRLQERLGKTRDSFVYRLDRLFLGRKEIDQDLFDELEEVLITADLGVATTMELLDNARKKVKRDKLSDPRALKAILRDLILEYIAASDAPAELVMPDQGPFVIMVVGVNGVGKTTTIGKIAAKFIQSGQSVLLVAGDTFRAAAINQLRIWGERVGAPVIAREPGADPSAVVFDGLEYGLSHNYDVILIDTAGRLHTSVNLMEELKKTKRVLARKLPGAPHEALLVLDATTGQNGIAQARLFHEAVGVTGLALTKLDGTAKGGIVANVCRELKIPVRFIGIGEQLDDLRDFDAREFVDALFAQEA